MALPKLFQRIIWHNNTTPAIQEDNLNAMSKGLSDVDDRLISLAGTIMEDVPQIQEDLEILEPAIENIDSNVERAETAADDAEDSAETAEYWANVSNPPIPVIKDFASVISVDDAIPKAATDVKVKVEAVQDLHGYTKPWVGGAGKNLLRIYPNFTGSQNGITVTAIADNAGNMIGVNVNGRATADCGITIFGKGIGDSFAPLSGKTLKIYGGANSNSNIYVQCASSNGLWGADTTGNGSSAFTVESTEPSNWNAQVIVKNGTQANNVKIYPMICLASESSTFEPYSNICPISGFAEAKVTRTGKNLFDKNSTDYVTGFIDINNQNITLQSGYSIAYIKCKPNTTYTISKVAGKAFRICTTKDEPAGGVAYISTFANHTATSMTVTTESNANYIAVMYYSQSNGDTLTPEQIAATLQIEIGSNATPYEPYNGTDYIIDLDGTRYGATLDVTSGVMTVIYACVDLGSYDYTNINEGLSYRLTNNDFTLPAKRATSASQVVPHMCSAYRYDISPQTAYSQRINSVCINDWTALYIVDTDVADATALKTKLNGVQLVYELATPITVQLTPTEVQMLQGYNVLSANSGDVCLKYDASMIQRIANEKLDISTFKSVVASSSDFADFKTRVAAL